jgi:pimeloyl-ACP methyl ester carboxylesterase
MILRTPNGPLYYEVTGAGPPVVFVSGWAMSSECWRPAVDLLKRKYRCLIYDHRGIGHSQPASQRASFQVEDHAADLHSILEAENIFDAVLIGHELGGLIASVCADRHPQDWRAMVLVSPRAGVTEKEMNNLAIFTPASLVLRELAGYPLIRNVVAWRFRRAPQPYRDALFTDFADLNPRSAYEMALSAASSDFIIQLESVIDKRAAPALIISGEKDQLGLAQGRKLFSSVRAGKLATMKACGFLPMLEYPGQFARLVDNFIKGLPEASRRALVRV